MLRFPVSLSIGALVLGALVPRESPAQALAAAIDRVFTAWNSSATPGCVAGVRRGVETMYVRAYGMADLDRRTTLTRESVIEVGPVARQFTAAAVVLLAQRGQLSLDDEVRKHVSDLPDPSARVTIRQLLARAGSDSAYALAAHIVERVSGESLAAFTESHFFGPLGMENTRVIVPEDLVTLTEFRETSGHTELFPRNSVNVTRSN